MKKDIFNVELSKINDEGIRKLEYCLLTIFFFI